MNKFDKLYTSLNEAYAKTKTLNELAPIVAAAASGFGAAVADKVLGPNEDGENEDFGNTDYDVEEGNIFERLEELMRSKPELENDLKPILNDFQDNIEDINSLDVDDDKIDVTDLGIHLNRLFPDV